MKSNINMQQMFRRLLIPVVLLLATSSVANAYSPGFGKPDSTASIEGRWDITVDVDGKKFPSWLEVRHSGLHMLVGQFVGIGGSARPISRVNFNDGKISFSIPPQWEPENNDLSVEGTLDGDSLSGSMTFSNGKVHNWTGIRAPALRRKSQPVWGKPIQLFDGKNLEGWHALG